jgi:hypothetical protein
MNMTNLRNLNKTEFSQQLYDVGRGDEIEWGYEMKLLMSGEMKEAYWEGANDVDQIDRCERELSTTRDRIQRLDRMEKV